MWTQNYKGLYIHGYCDKTECRVVTEHGQSVAPFCKNLRAAKLAITRHKKAK